VSSVEASVSSGQRIAHERSDADGLIVAIGVLWRYKYLVMVVTFIAGLIAVFLALTATEIYRAEVMIVQVRDQRMTGSAAPLLNQLSGLATLAGVTLPGAARTEQAQGLLQSRRLAEEFISRNNLLPVLWEGADPSEPQSMWLAVTQWREGVVEIAEDARRGTTTVFVEWKDPEVAARWANDYVALCNELMRQRALEETTRNIKYLNEQIATTNVVELQRVMYELVENEMQTLMLANARDEYAFSVIDPAVAPEERISPQRRVMVMIGLVLGGIGGSVLAFVLHFWSLYRAGRFGAPRSGRAA
jgi:uncharacterized protein involved in exopolysaccharide biosynthesis